MTSPGTSIHSLPVTFTPIHQETLGSYLHRLAFANKRGPRTLARLLGKAPRDFSSLEDSTGWLTPEAPGRLAVLSGRPLPRLARALPAIGDALNQSPAPIRLPYRLSRLCRLCAARRGAGTTLVVVRTPLHQHCCAPHHRWTLASNDIAVDPLPEILKSQQRLRHLFRSGNPTAVSSAFDLAGTVTQAWISTGWSTRFQPAWNNRLARLAPTPAIGVDEAAQLASFPEKVLLTELMLHPPISTSDPRDLYQAMTEALGSGLGIAYTGRARSDPLYRYFCKTTG